MRFIFNGDYILPLHFKSYWAEHLYMWSYQHGAANPDGIIRLPGRLIDMLVFAAFGNVGFAYFYLATCLLIMFLGFFWFARVFLEARRLGTQLIGALFFTCNPITLGYISKIGLLLAVAMLPIALTALKLGFEKRRFSYFLLCIAALNISLLHPFTFTLNLAACAAYAFLTARKHRSFIRDAALKFGMLAVTALLLNAYFILPLASLGTVSKDALSDTVTSSPTDYTSLVDIANTGDIFTGLSLSKGVLKDYEFYSPATWPVYFLGVFALYAILFGIYVRVEKRAKPQERRRFVIALAIFLVLLALSTASFLHIDALIKFIIGLPGGWMFRSPLKWQLYMPLALFTALVITLKYVRNGNGLHLAYAGLMGSFLLMNTYLFIQIHQRLLTPRSFAHFSQLAETPLEGRNLLFVNSNACLSFAREHPAIASELTQVFLSKGVQVKNIEAGGIDTVLVSQYDYVLGCTETLDTALLTKTYRFTPSNTYVQGTYALYRNTMPQPYVTATTRIHTVEQAMGLGGKYHFADKTLHEPLTFVTRDTPVPGQGLQDIFDTVSPASIQRGALTSNITPLRPGRQLLYLTGSGQLHYTRNGNTITLSVRPQQGSKSSGSTPIPLDVPEGETITVSYKDPAFSYKNLIPNPSFEQGLWQKAVHDCNNYDQHPMIGMRTITAGTNGSKALELTATRHTACTGPEEVAVNAGQHYLLHMDYASMGGRYAGYQVSFNDEQLTTTGKRLPDSRGQWTPLTTEFVAPTGASKARIWLYAYPDNAPGKSGVARYDTISLTRIPNIKNRFFVTSEQPEAATSTPPKTTYRTINPTQTTVVVTGVRQPFYLITKETYNKLWQLQTPANVTGLASIITSPVLAEATHMRTNGAMNGWYVDPSTLCQKSRMACTRAADGSYTLNLTMSYTPQRWFYIGAMISLATAAATAAYVAYDVWRARKGAQQ